MAKTDLIVKTRYSPGDNVFALIAPVYNALVNAGKKDLADEMQAKIDSEAKSPADVRKIVREYVEVR